MSIASPQGSLLLVTEDPTTQQVLCASLTQGGYRITSVTEGKQALALMATNSFDLLLLDTALSAPGASALLSAIRTTHSAEVFPVLLLTTDHQHPTFDTGLRLGANDYIPKPFMERLATTRVGVYVAYKRTAAALQASEARYALTAQGVRDGLWNWNLVTNQLYYSPRWKAVLGYTEEHTDNTPDFWLSRIHPEERDLFDAAFHRHLSGDTPHFEHEYRMLHRDGIYRWVLSRGLAARDATGKALYVAGSQTDITDRKEADVLTGLPNRMVFMERLQNALERLKRPPSCLFAVLLLNLDRFKMINESLGPAFGDQLLIAFTKRLEACLQTDGAPSHFRTHYTIARLGGDEFAILIEDIQGVDDAIHLANRLQQSLTTPFLLHRREVFTTASIGIAVSTASYNRPEEILRDADTAMSGAKTRGRGCHTVFDTMMRARAVASLHMETAMRRAVERQEFCVYYQPIVSLTTGQIVGFESLARWYDPQRGLVPPDEFIPIAEDNGLIIPIGWAILRMACQQMAAWQAQFSTHRQLAVSVNLSAHQFRQHDLVPQIVRVLEETRLAPHNLKLELTETALMDNPSLTARMLEQLRDLGIQLSLDDFGTGYSSLSYLHRFPVQILKIDRSFISRLDIPGEKIVIVRTILSLAAALGLEVVAEGIETMEQLTTLQQLSCGYGQGYFFSKPLPAEAATALLDPPPPWEPLSPLAIEIMDHVLDQ